MNEDDADEQVDVHWFHLVTRIESGVLDNHLHAIREAEWRRTPPRAGVLQAIHRRHQELAAQTAQPDTEE